MLWDILTRLEAETDDSHRTAVGDLFKPEGAMLLTRT
jgi:hypothetical protein